jgi:hypothetical protein
MNSLPELKIISRVRMDGWLANIFSIKKDSYIVGVNSSYGSVYLVDIRDKKNPWILSKLNNVGEEWLCVCVFSDNTYAFLGSDKGFRVLPL